MILVDSSVWIDYFRGYSTAESEKLDLLLGSEPVGIGDLMLTEVLQGFGPERQFAAAKKFLTELEVVHLGGREVAIQAARNFRKLRSVGITIRKTIDTIIATHCIEHKLDLLYSERDFDPFVAHLGLRSVALLGAEARPHR